MQWAFGDVAVSDFHDLPLPLLFYALVLYLLGKFLFAFLFAAIHRLIMQVGLIHDMCASLLANMERPSPATHSIST